jgi:hypothetical protein
MTRPRPKRPAEQRPSPRKACVGCQVLVARDSLDEQGRCESCASGQMELFKLGDLIAEVEKWLRVYGNIAD